MKCRGPAGPVPSTSRPRKAGSDAVFEPRAAPLGEATCLCGRIHVCLSPWKTTQFFNIFKGPELFLCELPRQSHPPHRAQPRKTKTVNSVPFQKCEVTHFGESAG